MCVRVCVCDLLTPRMRECEQLTFVVPLGCLRLVNSSDRVLAFSLAKRPHSGWGVDAVALRRVNQERERGWALKRCLSIESIFLNKNT